MPTSIKAEIGDLVHNGPKQNAPDASTDFVPPPKRFVYFTGSFFFFSESCLVVHATWSVIASEKDTPNHLHEFGEALCR